MTSSEIGVDAQPAGCEVAVQDQAKQATSDLYRCLQYNSHAWFVRCPACMHACTHTYSGLLSCCIQYSEAAQCIQEVSVDSLCLDVSVLLIPKFSLLQGS